MLVLIFVVLTPVAALADAIFPTLILIWPITALMFIPVVLIEAVYTKHKMALGFWESLGVVGVANILSTIAGLPLATLLSTGLRYGLESLYFRNLSAMTESVRNVVLAPSSLKAHDTVSLMVLGLYPRWLMISCAMVLMAVAFLISWWIEGIWLKRYVSERTPSRTSECVLVSRNANLLSYAFLTLNVLWVFWRIWPQGFR
jgi:hypothetical protein